MLTWISAGILLGIVVLLTLPPLVGSLGFLPGAQKIGNWYVNTAMKTLGRPAISVSPNTTFTLRQRGFDDTYSVETISNGSASLKLKQIPKSMCRWGGRPFTFVDEAFGVTFDLRDVAVGRREHELRQDGEMVFENRIYGDGGQVIDAYTFVRGFFDLDKGTRVLDMDLYDSLHPIVDGSEDANMWNRVREGVKRMFMNKDKLGLIRISMPLLGLVAGLMAAYYLFGPGQLPGGTAGSTVEVGSLLALLGLRDPDDDSDDSKSRDEQREQRGQRIVEVARSVGESVAGLAQSASEEAQSVSTATYLRFGAVAVLVAAVAVGALVVGVVAVAVTIVTAGLVAVGIPLLSGLVGAALPRLLSEPIAELWVNIGLTAFDDPLIMQAKTGISVIDADDADFDSGDRYRFCKRWVGFGLDVDSDTMGQPANELSDLSEYRSKLALPDGGETVLPTGWEPSSRMTNADHNGLVPTSSEADAGKVYVRTDLWLGRLTDIATGKIAAKSHRESLKEFADGRGKWTDERIMYLFVGLGILGLGLGFLIWGLLL